MVAEQQPVKSLRVRRLPGKRQAVGCRTQLLFELPDDNVNLPDHIISEVSDSRHEFVSASVVIGSNPGTISSVDPCWFRRWSN